MQFTKQDTLLVKGVAIIMMMVHHCYTTPDRYAGYVIDFGFVGEEITVMISSFFKICVSIFVFLSGYGITVSLNKQEISENIIMHHKSKSVFVLLCQAIGLFL